VRWFRYS